MPVPSSLVRTGSGNEKKKCMLIFAKILGNEGWNGQCSSGRRQSPIDLAEDASVIGRYPNLYFKNYDKLFENARIINTGHSREYTLHTLHIQLFPPTSIDQ